MTRFSFKAAFVGLMVAGLLLAQAPRSFAEETKPAAVDSSHVSASKAQSQVADKEEVDENDAYRKSPMVQNLGAKLGMNPDQAATAFEVLNFVVLAVLLGWLLLRLLPKTFRARNTSIQKHLVDARTATEEANVRLGSVEARLSKLDGEITAMREQAEKDAALDQQRIEAALEDEKQKILAAADQEIAAATTQAHRQLQRFAAELAIEQAGRRLVISAETDRLLVQNFARRLAGEQVAERNGDKGGQN